MCNSEKWCAQIEFPRECLLTSLLISQTLTNGNKERWCRARSQKVESLMSGVNSKLMTEPLDSPLTDSSRPFPMPMETRTVTVAWSFQLSLSLSPLSLSFHPFRENPKQEEAVSAHRQFVYIRLSHSTLCMNRSIKSTADDRERERERAVHVECAITTNRELFGYHHQIPLHILGGEHQLPLRLVRLCFRPVRPSTVSRTFLSSDLIGEF